MKKINSQVKIKAKPSTVWSIINNFDAYAQWNPFIVSIEGNIAVNKKIKVKIQPVGGTEMTFRPTILTYIKNKEITWVGRFLVKGLFDGTHTLELIDNHDGTTTFIQSECFSGLLVPLFRSMIEDKTLKGFCLMNQKLKELSEKQETSTKND